MERYIEQLIEDLRHARNNEEPPDNFWEKKQPENRDMAKHFEEVEKYVSGEGHPISQIIGVRKERLPSPEKLSEEQSSILANEMEKLWKYYNFYPSFPENLPGHIRYRLLRDNWDSEQIYVSSGIIGIEFCEYDESTCPFPEYCNACSEIKTDLALKYAVANPDVEGDDLLPEDERNFRKRVDEAKEIIKNTPIKDEFISGIYNYCDRWCERCEYTSRCLNFNMGKKLHGDDENMDITNKVFWEQLSVTFAATSELLIEMAEEMGINLEDEMVSDGEMQDQPVHDDHPLLRLSKDYADRVSDWFKENAGIIDQTAVNLSVIDGNNILNLKDAVEVIQWYEFFIYVKIKRAVDSLHDEHPDQELADLMADHTNGTAKVALIAIDRSIAAFGFLLTNIKEKEDEVLDFLALLGKIRNLAEKTFPDARVFIRPGFDE